MVRTRPDFLLAVQMSADAGLLESAADRIGGIRALQGWYFL
jgi:hypothetical protein